MVITNAYYGIHCAGPLRHFSKIEIYKIDIFFPEQKTFIISFYIILRDCIVVSIGKFLSMAVGHI